MEDSIAAELNRLGRQARAALAVVGRAEPEQKNEALRNMADRIRTKHDSLLAANEQDVRKADQSGLSDALVDRLRLDPGRIDAIADSLSQIAAMEDPVGEVLKEWTRPSGLRIRRVCTPLGVIGVIYESRPNVTADAAALCLKSGNAVILRGGSDSLRTSTAIHQLVQDGLAQAGLPVDAVQMVPTSDREAVGHLLSGLDGSIDVIVPRGGKSLVERVQREARVPVFAHLEGNCHLYIHRDADLDMACQIAVNSKMRRTGICGATETLLVDRAIVDSHLAPILGSLAEAACEIRGDQTVCQHWPQAVAATEADWGTEYLAPVVACRVVEDLTVAMEHIAQWSSSHTESIVTENEAAATEFLSNVDSAIVLHNASTQFADGGEFGMGAEIGIATGRIHARGPIGVMQLTTFRYQVFGSGQVRP